MKSSFLFATLALFAMVAAGCTREKPSGPDTVPPQIFTIPSLTIAAPTAAASLPTSPSGSDIAPTPGITNSARVTTSVDTSPISATPNVSASSSSALTPTLPLPSGIFSQIPPLGPTSNAPVVAISPTPTASAPIAQAAGPTTYTVQWGDWLSKIARQFGISADALISANPRINPNLLLPGQVLAIPGAGSTGPLPSGGTPTTTPGGGPTTYTVQRGDWFYAIARRFGVTSDALLSANPGANPNLVYPGQVLNIPGNSTSPAGATPTSTIGAATPTISGAAPTFSPTSSAVGKPDRYTVQPGDTLFSIAVRFNTTTYALQIENHLASPHFIYVGQVLVIPK